ncbi:MAG: DUF4931 domain-containing protein [Veillonella sp.]|nr:DUF4931 domain-containing protein [Veillonella sp.]
MNKPLRFNIELGRTKPVNIRNEQVRCPFCDRSKLTDILDTSGHIIWLMNKYPVLEKTWPTVIIETETDEGEFSTLPTDEAAHILQFGLDKWRETRQRKEFKSVLFFKNYGYMSGGSIRHPHSQIIGLENYDYHKDITAQNMEGWLLHEDQDVRITLSTHPIIGFFEYNIRSVALRLQQILRYVLHSVANFSQSYNYFVYNLEDGYDYIKVVARYVTTPLYVGYKIPQTCDEGRAAKIKHDITPYFQATK